MRPPAALRVGAGACGPRRAGASCGPVSSLCRTSAGLLCCRWTRIASGTSKRDRAGAGAAGRGLRPEGRVQESAGREVERVSRVSRLRGPGGPELFDLPREAREVAPGAVHVPDWLSTQEQAELVAQCRGWSRGDHRMRHYTTSTGGVMSVQSTVLGAPGSCRGPRRSHRPRGKRRLGSRSPRGRPPVTAVPRRRAAPLTMKPPWDSGCPRRCGISVVVGLLRRTGKRLRRPRRSSRPPRS